MPPPATVRPAEPPVAAKAPPLLMVDVVPEQSKTVERRYQKRKQSVPVVAWIVGGVGAFLLVGFVALLVTTPARKERMRKAHEQHMRELGESIRQSEALIAEMEAKEVREKAQEKAVMADLMKSAWFKNMKKDAASGILLPENCLPAAINERYPNVEYSTLAYYSLETAIKTVIHEAHANQSVYGLIESERKSLAVQILRLEDAHGYNTPVYNRRRSELEKRYGLTRDQVNEIMGEAIERDWEIGF